MSKSFAICSESMQTQSAGSVRPSALRQLLSMRKSKPARVCAFRSMFAQPALSVLCMGWYKLAFALQYKLAFVVLQKQA